MITFTLIIDIDLRSLLIISMLFNIVRTYYPRQIHALPTIRRCGPPWSSYVF